ncbi:hypothetical protein HPB48_006035 [Haemaphysalis longicornis]|uniref:Uncharacterized protein n=1 Tax=Haemaphysalis longicornis TaxID=44386 RepID=A0A9J6FK46_HAELO|nr:hypothetical protein HPB48_006035 [Haemaphysalis longicornis]
MPARGRIAKWPLPLAAATGARRDKPPSHAATSSYGAPFQTPSLAFRRGRARGADTGNPTGNRKMLWPKFQVPPPSRHLLPPSVPPSSYNSAAAPSSKHAQQGCSLRSCPGQEYTERTRQRKSTLEEAASAMPTVEEASCRARSRNHREWGAETRPGSSTMPAGRALLLRP